MMISYIIKYTYRKTVHLLIKFLSNINSKPLKTDNLGRVMIISPHPDDEVFGCGYLINKLSNSNIVRILILSKGEAYAKEYGIDQSLLISTRKKLAHSANNILGVKKNMISFLDFPDSNFENVDESEIHKLKSYILAYNPDTIFYPHPFENSPDHVAATKIINRITKNLAIKRYYFCVWVWHHMRLPQVFKLRYNISFILKGDRRLKKKAVNLYSQAMDENGNYYSGKLPQNLLEGITWSKELYFNAD